jgi:hypothetical protein
MPVAVLFDLVHMSLWQVLSLDEAFAYDFILQNLYARAGLVIFIACDNRMRHFTWHSTHIVVVQSQLSRFSSPARTHNWTVADCWVRRSWPTE